MSNEVIQIFLDSMRTQNAAKSLYYNEWHTANQKRKKKQIENVCVPHIVW